MPLRPLARAEVARLLAQEPGSTLASVSTWADEHRSPQTGRWHYVNFPRDADCLYEPLRDCAGGACVVAAIQRQTGVLRSSNADAEARLKALKYMVHLVADVHQPLHAGFGDDRGGNSYQLHGFGRGSNLHALWDSGLILNRPGAAAALQTRISRAGSVRVAGAGPSNAAQWASDSCRIASAPGFYPDAHWVDQAYADAHDEQLRTQLKVAAQRLAELLSESLGKQTEIQAALEVDT